MFSRFADRVRRSQGSGRAGDKRREAKRGAKFLAQDSVRLPLDANEAREAAGDTGLGGVYGA